MSLNPNALLTTDLNLRDVLVLLKKEIMIELNCHAICQVESFNSSSKTVQATFMYSKTFFVQDEQGNYVAVSKNYPTLIDVPVLVLGGGTSSLTFPITKGDECLVLFNDRDIANWYAGATSGSPASNNLHSLSDGLALVFRFHNLSDYDAVRALISNGTAKVGINPQNNKLTLTNGTSLGTILSNLISALNTLATDLQTNPSVETAAKAAGMALASALTPVQTDVTGLLE